MTQHNDHQVRMKQLFDTLAPSYDAVVPFFEAFGGKMVVWSELERGQQILDIAVGRGATLKPALDRIGPTGRIVGIDIAPTMIRELAAELRSLGVANVELKVMAAEELSFPSARFDAVLCGFALHLFARPRRVLAAVARVLKPGGVFVFSLPGAASGDRWRFYSETIRQFAPLVDAAKWSVSELPDAGALLHEAGFVLIEQLNEEVRLPIRNAETFWAMEMSHGMRGFIEALPAHAQTAFKAQVLRGLEAMEQRGGIVLDRGAVFYKAFKPKTRRSPR